MISIKFEPALAGLLMLGPGFSRGLNDGTEKFFSRLQPAFDCGFSQCRHHSGISVAPSGLQSCCETFTQGCVAALLALGFIGLPLRGSKAASGRRDYRRTV
jgi:hypothetical protein